MTPDTRWNANAAGTATSATLPAADEPDLPETGTFQVKVKAANTAGDSGWSDPVEATCGPPGAVIGLKCTAAADDGFTLQWDALVGAERYEARYRNRSLVPPDWSSWVRISESPSGPDKLDYTLGPLGASGLATYFDLQVRAVNDVGNGESSAEVKCRTLDEDWLDVDCTANGVLDVSWDNPPDSGQSYSVTVAADGVTQPSWRTKTFSGSTTRWAVLAAPTKTYRADIRSNGAGGPVYSQTATKACPALSTPDYNGPNVPEGLPGWIRQPPIAIPSTFQSRFSDNFSRDIPNNTVAIS